MDTPRTLEPGDRRRMSDGRNAWRKMTPEQRRDFLDWILLQPQPIATQDPLNGPTRELSSFTLGLARDGSQELHVLRQDGKPLEVRR